MQHGKAGRRMCPATCVALLALMAGGCESETTITDTTAVSTYDWPLPADIPRPREPRDNPMTAEKVELGRFLFHDVRLSGNGTQSCASCHEQALAFTDGRARAIGSTGEVHPRSAQSLANVAYNATMTWANPALLTLEQQMLVPLFGENPVEMGITDDNAAAVLDRLRDDPRYPPLFAAAFPGDPEINFGNIVAAIASFQRRLLSFNAPFDRAGRGEPSALSESARRGMALFNSEQLECHHCHGGFNFTLSTDHGQLAFVDRPFHNTGLFNIGGTGAFPFDNQGIIEITGIASDMGRFRAPTLRNIAVTAPYMHDGSLATLEDVIDFYAAGGRFITEGPLAGDGRLNPFKDPFINGFTLDAQEREDLLAFLHSLTDEEFLNDPALADPFGG